MSDNPYQPPETVPEVVGILSGTRADLKSVARYQRGIIICILIYLIGAVCSFVVPADFRPIISTGVILTSLIGTIFVFLLAMKVYSTAVGILLGVLTFVPCVGLIVLLMVNGKATTVLRQNGISVGLLGANLSDL